jgi:UDP-N-acetylglucosamine diphosphorylase / glucose-1-phosphate thymidylyltransferase / UDP-N-acetylgalactosamine diphosphorylase / glucosamine-1-phosphate N-acetyltransferase / galactosamine-1-phosphate N-acetyltransferase
MQAVILAAGESSRFWPINGCHKSLMKIMGKPLILSLIEGIKEKGIREVIIVQGSKKEIQKELKNYKLPLSVKYVVQPVPLGTGDAILKAQKNIKEHFFVLNAERVDAKEHIAPILEKFKKERALNKIILIAGKTLTPWLYGILKVKGDKVITLVEKPRPGKEPSDLKIVGTYFFPKKFLNYLKRVPSNPYSLGDALSLYTKEKEVKIVNINKETFALKYPWDLFDLRNYILDQMLEEKISKTSRIAGSAKIEGKVFIGENVKIFDGVSIKGPCYIGDNSVIGNNVLLRDYTNLEKNSLIGAFAEVTRSIFQENCRVHSGYFGDSIFNANCMAGAGTITANIRLDGEKIKSIVKEEKIETGLDKLGVIVGKNTRIGINVSFMPGVLVGRDCQVGPQSLVLGNIKDNTVFYTKAEGIIENK